MLYRHNQAVSVQNRWALKQKSGRVRKLMNDEPGEPLAYYNRTDLLYTFFTCASVIKNDISVFQKINLELLSTLLEIRFGIFNNLKEEKK